MCDPQNILDIVWPLNKSNVKKEDKKDNHTTLHSAMDTFVHLFLSFCWSRSAVAFDSRRNHKIYVVILNGRMFEWIVWYECICIHIKLAMMVVSVPLKMAYIPRKLARVMYDILNVQIRGVKCDHTIHPVRSHASSVSVAFFFYYYSMTE